MNIVIAIIILLIYTLIMIKIGGSILPSLSASIFNIPINKRWIWTVVILAPVFWSWIGKPICNKLNIGYRKDDDK